MGDSINIEECERVKKQISIFNEIGKTLTSSLTINEVLEKIFFKVAEFFSPENWSLLLVDEEKGELYFKLVVGRAAENIKDIRLKIGEGIAGWVAETGRPLFVPSVKEDPRFTEKIDRLSRFSTESIICIPLKIRGRVLGVIELVNNHAILEPNQYDMEILTTVAEYAAIALENARNYEHVQRLTITDDLTGLYNSRHLHNVMQAEIDRSKKDNSCFSVIFLDLDFFKNINDAYGHLVGSQLLGRVGRLISENISACCSAARYGGDEFVIVLPQTAKKEAVDHCKSIRQQLNRKIFFSEKGFNIQITASFGISTFPDDADTKDQILGIADERMYRVKDRQKNDIAFS